ncbi:hypothetical protein J974_3660, partial [Acinetobacter baumannii 26016_8]
MRSQIQKSLYQTFRQVILLHCFIFYGLFKIYYINQTKRKKYFLVVLCINKQ